MSPDSPAARRPGNRGTELNRTPPNFYSLISIFGTQNGKLVDIAYPIFFVKPN